MAAMISSRRAETGKPSGNSIVSDLATRAGSASVFKGGVEISGRELGDEFTGEFGNAFGVKGLDKTDDNLGDNPQLSQPDPAGTTFTPTQHVRCF
jgi:hypothetical protein